MRLDKYIWSVRLAKTRTIATDACNGGKIKLNNSNAKAAKEVKLGDKIELRKGLINRSYEIIGIPNGRVGPKLVEIHLKETTPETEILKFDKLKYISVLTRDPGTGRPTKKDRREIDDLMDWDLDEAKGEL